MVDIDEAEARQADKACASLAVQQVPSRSECWKQVFLDGIALILLTGGIMATGLLRVLLQRGWSGSSV